MSSIIVRGLDDAVKQQRATQAKEHGRSMDAEVRDILTRAARRPHIGMALLAATPRDRYCVVCEWSDRAVSEPDWVDLSWSPRGVDRCRTLRVPRHNLATSLSPWFLRQTYRGFMGCADLWLKAEILAPSLLKRGEVGPGGSLRSLISGGTSQVSEGADLLLGVVPVPEVALPCHHPIE